MTLSPTPRTRLCYVACLGDSITASGWPGVMERRLREAGWADAHCHNAGVRGNTSTQGLHRLEKAALAHSPDAVFLQFGFNDCNVILNARRPRTDPVLFWSNLRELVHRVRHAGAEALLIANHPTLWDKEMPDGRTYEAHAQEYSAITAEVAAELPAPLLDMRTLFPGPDLPLADALDQDGIHLSPLGIERYGAIASQFLLGYGAR